MKNRKERLSLIIYLLTNKIIGSQEELLSELASKGFAITQATLSRDMKQLQIAKVPNGKGGYRYVATTPVVNGLPHSNFGGSKVAASSDRIIVSINRSDNIVIIRTTADQARMLANAFRSVNDNNLLESLASNDVVILILAQKVTDESVYHILTSVIDRELVNKLNLNMHCPN